MIKLLFLVKWRNFNFRIVKMLYLKTFQIFTIG